MSFTLFSLFDLACLFVFVLINFTGLTSCFVACLVLVRSTFSHRSHFYSKASPGFCSLRISDLVSRNRQPLFRIVRVNVSWEMEKIEKSLRPL